MEELKQVQTLNELEKELIQLIRTSGLEEFYKGELIKKCTEIRQKRQNIVFSQLKYNLQLKNESKILKLKRYELYEMSSINLQRVGEIEISFNDRMSLIETNLDEFEIENNELVAFAEKGIELKKNELKQCESDRKYSMMLLISIIVILLLLRLM